MAIQIQQRKLGNTNKLRNNQLAPAIIYGNTLEQAIPVQMPAQTLSKILAERTTTTLFGFELNGETIQCILRDYQMDPLHTQALHADFQMVTPDEMVSVKVAINFTGTEHFRGQKVVLHKSTQQLPIRCKASDIPEAITIDVGTMKKGDRVYVRDLELPTSSSVMLSASNIVASLN